MKTLEIDQATKPLSKYASRLGSGMLVLTSHHKPVAAVVSLEGVDQESLILSSNPEFMKVIRQSRADFAKGRRISLAEMKKEFGQD
jgi:PHD/YefM family antitoxin component YafN of YafNO toxin-antitoxin module